MDKNRLEAFSDGVLAIIITIMVLELKVPHGDSLATLIPLWPVLLSYILSFLYVGIYWNNHHHMFKAVHKVNGVALWANLNLLFWLSLLPFSTGWMGENHFARYPVLLYGINLLLCAIAYTLLQLTLVRFLGADSLLARAIGRDIKGKVSVVCYLLGCVFAAAGIPLLSLSLYVVVAMIWLLPDRRLEVLINSHSYEQ
jgi:uncharacterized membrane protein